MRYVMCIAVIAAVLLGTSSLGAADEPDSESGDDCRQIEPITGGISCLDNDGHAVWERFHPSLWGEWSDETREAYLERRDAEYDVAWTKLDSTLVYSVHRDLLVVTPEDGTVDDRHRFPARIRQLEPAGDQTVEVTLELSSDPPGTDWTPEETTLTVTHHLDAPPSQMPWHGRGGPCGRFSTYHDAYNLLIDEELDQDTADEPDGPVGGMPEIIRRGDLGSGPPEELPYERLEEAREADPTNPFYSLFLAENYRAMDDDEAARRAYRRAAEAPGDWQDMMWLSAKLEKAGEPELAQRAFETGFDQFEHTGIEPDRLYHLAAFSMTFLSTGAEPQTGVERGIPMAVALAEDDVQRADTVVSRHATVFPNLEGGAITWHSLGEWMHARGADDKADAWRERAQENLESVRPIEHAAGERLQTWLVVLAGLIVGLLGFALVAGLRRGLRHDDPDSTPAWGGTGLDVLALAIMGLATVGALFAASVEAQQVAELPEVPQVMLTDALASPETDVWLDSLAPSPERETLREISERERRSFIAGDNRSEAEPVFKLVARAVAADARADMWQTTADGRLPVPAVEPGGAAADRSLGPGWLAGGALVVVVLFGIGWLLARIPSLARGLLMAVPGGLRSYGAPGAVALGLSAAAVAALLGLDQVIVGNLEHFFLHQYQGLAGLELVLPDALKPTRWWAWTTLVVVGLLQVGLVSAALSDSSGEEHD